MRLLFKQIGIKDAAINPPARSLFSLRRPALEEVSSDGHASKEPPSFTSARVNTLVSLKAAVEKGENKKRSKKGPKRKICKYEGCDNQLVGRQTKFCSAACSQADYMARQATEA